jgi:pimeloyl-ACP methyl ester carboxylesterase
MTSRTPRLSLLLLAAACTVAPSTGGAPSPSRAAAASSATAPCVRPLAACERWVTFGAGPSRSRVFATYPLDAPNPAITRALIMVHGAGRNADHYFETATAAGFLAGALDDAIIIAPRFAAARDTLAPNEIAWPERGENWRSGGTAQSTPVVTSFDFVDALVRILADKSRFPNLRHIVIAGHSAGGQYATRYAMVNRVHDTPGVSLSYVVANPSSYAWPTALRPLPVGDAVPTRGADEALGPDAEKVHTDFTYGPFDSTKAPGYNRWPSGMENLTGYARGMDRAQLLRQLAERPTTFLLGQVDVLPLGGFDSSPNAMAQGPTRRSRGEAFVKYLADSLGAKHKAIIVSECGHNDRCVYTTDVVLPVIFPK